MGLRGARREDHVRSAVRRVPDEWLFVGTLGTLPALDVGGSSRGPADHVPGGRPDDHRRDDPALGPAEWGMGGPGEGRSRVIGLHLRAVVAAWALLLGGTHGPSATHAEVGSAQPRPAGRPVEVSGPVQGGAGQATRAVQDLAARGYAEEEYFYGGAAATYAGPRRSDGVWDAREG